MPLWIGAVALKIFRFPLIKTRPADQKTAHLARRGSGRSGWIHERAVRLVKYLIVKSNEGRTGEILLNYRRGWEKYGCPASRTASCRCDSPAQISPEALVEGDTLELNWTVEPPKGEGR